MNRERSPSVDGERRSRPRWDNPTGQLPGAGVPSGVNSGEETLLCLTGLV